MRHALRVRFPGAFLAVVLLASAAPAAITIATVPVGNPGNARDPATGNLYGQVNYAYHIGKYEVTAGQYTAFLNAVAATDAYDLYNPDMARTDYGSGIVRTGASGSYSYSVHPAFANRPVNYVSFGDALRFANWLHNGQPTEMQDAITTEGGAYSVNGETTLAGLNTITRAVGWKWALTSEDEWYKAAYHRGDGSGGNYFAYPTGGDDLPGRDLSDASGNNANYGDSNNPIQAPYFTTQAGEFQASDSPYGTFDQAGNVYEWNEAVIGSFRGLRGGSFSSSAATVSSDHRIGLGPPVEGFGIGFRVTQAANVPEPASLFLPPLAAAALLARRRDRH